MARSPIPETPRREPSEPLLVGDVGGTNVRLAVHRGGELAAFRAIAAAPGEPIDELIRRYLDALPGELRPARGVLDVAGPAEGDEIRLTNRDWGFSVAELRGRLGLASLRVINDLAAIAAGALTVGTEALEELAPGTPLPGAPRAVIGVGTGLGVALAVPCGDVWRVVATEGGHRDLAAADEEEWRVVRALQRRHGHAAAETALSGLGLVELYRALGEIHGGAAPVPEPSEIDRRARAGEPLALRTLSRFSGWLGAFAGDLALSTGARGGVYLAGGVLPRLLDLDLLDRDLFRRRFAAKGRFEPWLCAIPVRLILQPDVALQGCARVAEGAVVV